jgi:hypothetical protein
MMRLMMINDYIFLQCTTMRGRAQQIGKHNIDDDDDEFQTDERVMVNDGGRIRTRGRVITDHFVIVTAMVVMQQMIRLLVYHQVMRVVFRPLLLELLLWL